MQTAVSTVQAAVNPASITAAISMLAALSVSTERLVEIIKGMIPWLNNQNANASQEGWRQAALHLLAALCGVITASMAGTTLQGVIPHNWASMSWPSYLVIGLLVSGGSGFWNSILSYAKATKDLKETSAATAAAAAPAAH